MLDISYFTVVFHRDRLIEQGAVRFVKKVNRGQSVLQITCPQGAEQELGMERPASPARVVHWS